MHAQQQQDNVEMRRSFNTSPNNICIQRGHSIEQAPHLDIVYDSMSRLDDYAILARTP